jgi:hypothetical protein
MLAACNPLFVGRVDDLRRMAAELGAGVAGPPGHVIAITGMGGLGKTQLAVEFVHRYGRHFAGGVFWLGFANPEEVALQIAACGGPGFMDLRAGFADLRPEEQLALVGAAWQRPYRACWYSTTARRNRSWPGGGPRAVAAASS